MKVVVLEYFFFFFFKHRYFGACFKELKQEKILEQKQKRVEQGTIKPGIHPNN